MKYYTYKKDVPLRGNQVLRYDAHKGYYAKTSKPTSKAPRVSLHPRTALVGLLHWGITNADRIHYREVRPITRVKEGQKPRLPWTTDCSGSGTTLCQSAGIPDPNGKDYNGEGYTGTIMAHCRKIDIQQLKVGDPVVFGTKSYPKGHHVTWVIAIYDRSPSGILCFSHGSEKGPFAITVAEEAKYQPDGLAGVKYYSLGV